MASPDRISETDAHAISSRLMQLSSRAQRWGINRTLQLEEMSLSFSQISVLYNIRHGVTTPGAIARNLQVTPRAITSMADRLQEARMLVRRHDEQDRRRVQLELTPDGRRIRATGNR